MREGEPFSHHGSVYIQAYVYSFFWMGSSVFCISAILRDLAGIQVDWLLAPLSSIGFVLAGLLWGGTYALLSSGIFLRRELRVNSDGIWLRTPRVWRRYLWEDVNTEVMWGHTGHVTRIFITRREKTSHFFMFDHDWDLNGILDAIDRHAPPDSRPTFFRMPWCLYVAGYRFRRRWGFSEVFTPLLALGVTWLAIDHVTLGAQHLESVGSSLGVTTQVFIACLGAGTVSALLGTIATAPSLRAGVWRFTAAMAVFVGVLWCV